MTLGTNVPRVLVTGATGKLGQVIAKAVLDRGWSVIVTARSVERAVSLATSFEVGADRAIGLALDLEDEQSIRDLVGKLNAAGKLPTHLVNNARSLSSLAVQDDGSAAMPVFEQELRIDVVAPYRLIVELSQASKSPLKTIVNIGSQYGEIAPNPQLYDGDLSRSPVQYGVAKAALHHMTRELAVRLGPDIRVNCVAFGGFQGRVDEDFLNRYAALSPNRRMLQDEEAAGPVMFLLGDESSSVTGHVLVADGGWSIW